MEGAPVRSKESAPKRRMAMKFTRFVAPLVVALCGLQTSFAQTQTYLIAKVPFSFTVENQRFPAGEYRFSTTGTSRMLIEGALGTAPKLFLALPAESPASDSKGPRLVFHRYGSRLYLSSLWTTAGERGRELLISRSEQESAKAEAVRKVEILARK